MLPSLAMEWMPIVAGDTGRLSARAISRTLSRSTGTAAPRINTRGAAP